MGSRAPAERPGTVLGRAPGQRPGAAGAVPGARRGLYPAGVDVLVLFGITLLFDDLRAVDAVAGVN